MPRLPLIHIPNGLYSVVSKCNNEEFLFDSKEKFELYLEHQIKCKSELGFILYDICCMSNHVHELYRVPENVTIAQILQRVKGHFSQKFNKLFDRKGHFWRNKPFYRIIEDEQYALNTMNYFHMNPVKAGLVRTPEEWPYSGFRFHQLHVRDGLLGKLLDPIPGTSSLYLDKNKLKAVEKILKNSKGRFIGGRKFRNEMRRKYGRAETSAT